jgi:hypothetical protein
VCLTLSVTYTLLQAWVEPFTGLYSKPCLESLDFSKSGWNCKAHYISTMDEKSFIVDALGPDIMNVLGTKYQYVMS